MPTTPHPHPLVAATYNNTQPATTHVANHIYLFMFYSLFLRGQEDCEGSQEQP